MRGSRKRGSFRRRLAGFLAACLVVTNLQGLTFAYGAEEDVIEEQAQLIQLDMSAMQSAVQDAAESGVLITAPEMAASAANAWVDLPFTKPAYELSPGNIEALLADETELPAHTSLRIFLEPLEENEEDEAEENGSYVITGNENLIFLIENDGSEAQAYQIQFGDKVTDVIVAESRKELRKELKGEDEEEEFVGGAGAVESTEAPVVESTEATAEAPTEESTEAVTEESSQAAPEESTEESSQAESEESTEAGPNAGTEESTEAENESESQAETEESSNAETEESSQAETAEPETEETTEAVTEETSPAETTPETSLEESTPVAESEGETEAETSTEAVTEATTEGTTSESTETETETEEATETVTETATEAATDSASVDSLEDAVAETEDAGNEDGGDEPVVVVEEEEEADVPEEGQVAPENESPIAALWKTTVNFLTGNITAHAAGTATPPEATETEPESESDTENQNQGNSGSNGGSGSAGGSQAEDDTDVPVATDGNADQKPGKKPEKEKVFTKADGLEGLSTLNIDAVNVLVDGGLKQANGGMFRMMMAAAADAVGGEKAVAMFKVPMSAVLAAEKAGDSSFQMTLYDYANDAEDGKDPTRINNYLNSLDGKEEGFRFGAGPNYSDPDSAWTNPWNGFRDKDNTQVNIFQGIVNKQIGQDASPTGEYLDTDLFPDANVKYKNNTVIKKYQVNNPRSIFTISEEKESYGYYVYDSKNTPVRYVYGPDVRDEEGNVQYTTGSLTTNLTVDGEDQTSLYSNDHSLNVQEKLAGGFWPFTNKNFFHGMKFSFEFSLLRDGKTERLDEKGDVVTDRHGNPIRDDMVFEFQGDDDVWVYLTDTSNNTSSKLVLDVGGDHNSMTGTINFATGEVKYERTSKELAYGNVVYKINEESPKAYLYTYDDWKKDYPRDEWMSEWALERKFKELYPLGAMDLERKDLAQYRLDFYYLERGGKGSNCYLKFNTPIVKKDAVTVAKKVVSDDSTLLNGKYQFELRINGDDKVSEIIEVTVQEGYGTASSKKKYAPDTKFELKEVDAKGATKTEWLDSAGGVQSTTSTVEGTLGEVLMCINYYDNLAPKISKQANLTDANKPGYYDLVLGVQGATIESTVEGETESYKAKDIVAKDTLSDHVEFDLEDGKPQIQLKSGDQSVDADVRQTPDGWSVSVNGEEIANIADKKITWDVTKDNETFGKDERKELHIAIHVIAPYKSNYDNDPMPDDGTGTHAVRKEKGYYSNKNDEAKVTYRTEISEELKTLPFPKPVVRPAEPDGTLTLTKIVKENGLAPDKKFNFRIELNDLTVAEVKLPDGKVGIVENGQLVLGEDELDKIQLGDGDAPYQITGLNSGATYTITELNPDASGDTYYSELTKVEVNGDKMPFEDGSISGTISGTVEENIKHTIEKQTTEETTTYTWTHWLNSNKVVTAPANNKAAIVKAQEEVARWLRSLGYYNIKTHSESDKYKVSGENFIVGSRTVTPTIETKGGSDFWEFGGTKYYDVDILKDALSKHGYEYRLEAHGDVIYWETSASSATNSVTVVFTNTLTAYDKIYVEKKVEKNGLNIGDETYKFQVQKRNAKGEYDNFTAYTAKTVPATGESERVPVANGSFTINGEGMVELTIKDRATGGTYRVVETDNGSADATTWTSAQTANAETTESGYPSPDVTNGGIVTCTNTYYSNTLTVTKELDEAGDFIPVDTEFTFQVIFEGLTDAEIGAIPYKITKVDTSQKYGMVAHLRNEDDIIEFKLKDNETIEFTELPTKLSYKITEQELGGDLANYSSSVTIKATGADGETSIVDNGVAVSGKTVSGSFASSDAQRTQNITYFNKIDWETGSLTITKNLVDEAGQSYTATEDAIFIFTVEKTDAPAKGAKYTVSINLKGESTDSITLNNLPYGTYTVTEAPHIRYRVEGDAERSGIEVGATAGAVTFTNKYLDRGYFSDVDITVNKVTPDGEGYKFEPEEAADSESETPTTTPTSQPVASLPQDEFRFKDESDEDTYLV